MQNDFNIWLRNAITLSRKTKAIASIEDFDRISETTKKTLTKIYEENPLADKEDVHYEMDAIIDKLIKRLIDIPDFRSDAIRRSATKKLINNRELMEKIYNEIITEERKSGKKIKNVNIMYYSSNIQKALKQTIKEAIIVVRKTFLETDEETRRAIQITTRDKENLKKFKLKLDKRKKTREQLKQLKGLFSARNEFEQIKFYIEQISNIETIDAELKEGYIDSIILVGESLNELDVLGKYIKLQNRENSKLKLNKLTPLDEKSPFETLFNKEDFKKLNICTLSALYAFWTNRLVKEVINMYKSYFIMYELNLDSKEAVTNGKLSSKITQEDFDALKLKFNAIHIKTEELYMECRKISREKMRINITKQIEQLEKKYGQQYNKYFSGIGGLKGLENDFYNDFCLYNGLENLQKNLYGQKDSSIMALLNFVYNNDTMSSNWGIIEENKKSDYVLIGIDIEGLNMPLRLHIKKDMVKEFIQGQQGNNIIPLYEGKEDFIVNGKYIGTQVLAPFTKAQKKEIEEMSTEISETDYRNRFVKHLAYLVDMLKFPEHLQQKRIIIKKGKTKTKYERTRKYIDLETMKKYSKTKDGNFVIFANER